MGYRSMNVFRIKNSPENEIERRLLAQKGAVFFREKNLLVISNEEGTDPPCENTPDLSRKERGREDDPADHVFAADTPREYSRLVSEGKNVFGMIPDLCFSDDSWPEGAYLMEQSAKIDDAYLRLVRARCQKIPYVTAVGDRVYLRELWEEDAPEMFWSDGSPEEKREMIASYRKHVYLPWSFGIWGVFRKKDHRLLGRAGLEYDSEGEVTLGYEIGEAYRRQGYAFEAVCLALECFRQLDPDLAGVRPVVVCISPENVASQALIRKVREQTKVLLEVRIITHPDPSAGN